jgi:hypothetical protein
VNSNVSGITYDQFSRATAYDFTFSCASGTGKPYSGRVYNIQRNNLGQAPSADVSVNGTVCHFTF